MKTEEFQFYVTILFLFISQFVVLFYIIKNNNNE